MKLGRHFVGCEQDKTYAALAARRLNEAAPGEIADAAATSASGLRSRQQALFAKA
jgi:DNA modification methylase